jgi:hypothetical protein
MSFANKRRLLTIREANDLRKITLKWGRAFMKTGFRSADFTSYFHYFHEHLWWESMYKCLEFCSTYMTESQIRVSKNDNRDAGNVFKRPRKGETNELSGCRRLAERSNLRQKVLLRIASEEEEEVKEKAAERNKMVCGRVLTFGGEDILPPVESLISVDSRLKRKRDEENGEENI